MAELRYGFVGVTNERWLKWATARHFRKHGFKVNMNHVKVGNAAVDGEILGVGWKMAVEIKFGHDDIVRGLGQIDWIEQSSRMDWSCLA
jgi:hypothetical protein